MGPELELWQLGNISRILMDNHLDHFSKMFKATLRTSTDPTLRTLVNVLRAHLEHPDYQHLEHPLILCKCACIVILMLTCIHINTINTLVKNCF
jgi:hypothetical protein